MSRPWKCDQDAILAAYRAGEPIIAIAEHHGCTQGYVSRLAKRRGAAMRMPEAVRANMSAEAKLRQSVWGR